MEIPKFGSLFGMKSNSGPTPATFASNKQAEAPKFGGGANAFARELDADVLFSSKKRSMPSASW